MNVFLVAGARPNFMKIAPLYRESLTREGVTCRIVHTGQHYDYEMSQTFFDDLQLPQPDYFLNAGSGSHAEQTARVMVTFEELCAKELPDLVIVVGDVNSTLACSIVAKKAGIRVAHVEAGLRSFDLSMPEEINRMVTDSIADLYFVTETSAVRNLFNEGKPPEQIFLVGHVMVDNLLHQMVQVHLNGAVAPELRELKQKAGEYVFMTLHRPSNVDDEETFRGIAFAVNEIAARIPIIFPVHPRTRKMMESFGIQLHKGVTCLPPLSFSESLYFWKDARVVMTDSGGLQEETTALGVPCVTIRENTERPITVEMGTNVLAGTDPDRILTRVFDAAEGRGKRGKVPPFWDGKAAERIWDVIGRKYGKVPDLSEACHELMECVGS
ncbi:UDP-N-acetylglucosamine 2-epimerase [Geobacter metallireducens RCH3]|uniref:UDP-N-acetylglucosamine 2-epimerase n=1 Tax=Geobacter metallireducens (strain ATCC 53774 / DSM 7210 / GS-15) TaxID=269799 RepID=Q39VI6_GEOMG|nr:UDP-N-acetylglucosamine 2-epimerase (non-hydrolyzing) [Geobacter metallireducens]ABB31738.1 UDP-N-acetylglucosamine 2-epimerase [Geobacter metallireducens GS-15]EHP89384.1 UDP-N-acetylglucosamine 2-epimerase [Geobacter metallireducens RCH3]